MRQHGQITVALAIGGILLALVFPWTLAAQEDKFIDCRERSCDVNDFLIAFQKRGIPTTAMPAVAMPRTAVALNVYFATNSDRIAPKYYAELNKLGRGAHAAARPRFEIAGYTDSLGSDQAQPGPLGTAGAECQALPGAAFFCAGRALDRQGLWQESAQSPE